MFLRLKKEKGAAAVEFALLLPVLVIFAFGIIYFGPVFNNYITIIHAARDGARLLAVETKFDEDGNISNGTDARYEDARLMKYINNNIPQYIKDIGSWGHLDNINVIINHNYPDTIGYDSSVKISGDVVLNIPFVFENRKITVTNTVHMRQEQ